MSKTFDVFVSYAQVNRPEADRLVALLEADGLRVFWDLDISAGQDLDLRIDDAIRGARCVVVLWTAESVRRRWVRAEARLGLERGVLVPVVVGPGVILPVEFTGVLAVQLESVPKRLDSPEAHRVIDAIHTAMDSERPVPARPATRCWPRRIIGAVAATTAAIIGGVMFFEADPATAQIVATKRAGERVSDVAVADGSLWVTSDNALWRLDTSAGTGRRFDVVTAREVAADHDVVGVTSGGSVISIVVGETVTTFESGLHVTDIAVAAGQVWIAHGAVGPIEVYDPAQGKVAEVDLPGAMALSAAGNVMFATAYGPQHGTLASIDVTTRTIRATATTPGPTPDGVQGSADLVWVTDSTLGSVTSFAVADLGEVASQEVGVGTIDLATDGHAVWVSSGTSAEVIALDRTTLAILGRVATADLPFKLDGDASGVWVTTGTQLLEVALK